MVFEVSSKTRTGNEIAARWEAEIYFRSEQSDGIEDALIDSLITLARETMESALNRSLVANEIEVYAQEWKGYLPYGPIDVDSIVYSETTETKGNKYPYVIVGETGTTITYDTIPFEAEGLKNAVLELAAYWYERGEYSGGQIPAKLKPIINLHKLRFSI